MGLTETMDSRYRNGNRGPLACAAVLRSRNLGAATLHRRISTVTQNHPVFRLRHHTVHGH